MEASPFQTGPGGSNPVICPFKSKTYEHSLSLRIPAADEPAGRKLAVDLELGARLRGFASGRHARPKFPSCTGNQRSSPADVLDGRALRLDRG